MIRGDRHDEFFGHAAYTVVLPASQLFHILEDFVLEQILEMLPFLFAWVSFRSIERYIEHADVVKTTNIHIMISDITP